ncbi:MAG: aminoacyl-tRNA hydrolase, partial [Bacteroidales bacterium]
MKFLIIGLGNIGTEYEGSRHNIGFMVVDHLAKKNGATFTTQRYASVCEIKYKGNTLILIKPTTYMNLSGKAVNYWLSCEKIPIEQSLTIVDDLALDVGQIRMKSSGSDGGHNGLANIAESIGTTKYPRLRFGIGNNYAKGFQIDYVLGKFSQEETKIIDPKLDMAGEMIQS